MPKPSQIQSPQPAEHPYLSRDDSWLAFNQRVLEEAQDATNPLLERVKFLAITASNLDEFVEDPGRPASSSALKTARDRPTPHEEDHGPHARKPAFERLSAHMQSFVAAQYTCWNASLLPALASEKIRVLEWDELDKAARTHALHFYQTEVDPLPHARSPSTHPIPLPARAEQGPLPRPSPPPQTRRPPPPRGHRTRRRHRPARAAAFRDRFARSRRQNTASSSCITSSSRRLRPCTAATIHPLRRSLPRHSQQQPLPAGRRVSLRPRKCPHRTPQPPQR